VHVFIRMTAKEEIDGVFVGWLWHESVGVRNVVATLERVLILAR